MISSKLSKHFRRAAGFLLLPALMYSQESTVYVSVVATKMFVVGAANPQTGIHYQHPSADTVWQKTGPDNIRAFGVAAFPGSDGRVLYIASGNGVHRSTNGGASWKITTGWQVTEVQAVCPDPRDPNTVYIATPYGVFKTVDGCATWSPRNTGLGALFISAVVVDHMRPNTVYCSTEDGAYKSTDGAATWTRLGLSVGNVRTLVQHPRRPDILLAGTENHGVYRTTNGGTWWERCEAGIDHNTFYAIAFDPGHPDTVYAAGYVTGVYRSLDGGISWKRKSDGLSVLTFHSLAVDPRASGRVYAGAYWGGVFRSDSGGESWRRVGLGDSQVWTIHIQP